MKVTPEERKLVYFSFTEVYRERTNSNFKWKAGEKGRVFSSFKLFAVNYSQDFDECFDIWVKYLSDNSSRWVLWDKADRSNYVGFMCKSDRVTTFATRMGAKKAKMDKNVGVIKNDDYYF